MPVVKLWFVSSLFEPATVSLDFYPKDRINPKRKPAMIAQLISLRYQVPNCDTSLGEFPVVIGFAHDAEIRLEDHSVSKYHCQIDFINGELVVQDLESLHGTYVNSCRVDRATLNHGDELAVGLMTFLVQYDQVPENQYRPANQIARRNRRVASLAEMVAQ
jgi:pSer/pThr/pTyr-binding forkhead associated (FHA) protein